MTKEQAIKVLEEGIRYFEAGLISAYPHEPYLAEDLRLYHKTRKKIQEMRDALREIKKGGQQ